MATGVHTPLSPRLCVPSLSSTSCFGLSRPVPLPLDTGPLPTREQKHQSSLIHRETHLFPICPQTAEGQRGRVNRPPAPPGAGQAPQGSLEAGRGGAEGKLHPCLAFCPSLTSFPSPNLALPRSGGAVTLRVSRRSLRNCRLGSQCVAWSQAGHPHPQGHTAWPVHSVSPGALKDRRLVSVGPRAGGQVRTGEGHGGLWAVPFQSHLSLKNLLPNGPSTNRAQPVATATRL